MSALFDQNKPLFAKVARRIIPILFVCYIFAFLDRVNVGFAKLQMSSDLAFSDTVFGFGAGIFFLGYFLFEVPSNIVLARVGARRWIARIMISWGLISCAFMLVDHIHWGPVAHSFHLSDAEFTFYVLRFLLGAAEAGFFPGIILYLTYWFPAAGRARMVALFMTAIACANVIGGPLSGAILQIFSGVSGLRGWQWLFLLEGLPSVLMGFLVFRLLPNSPAEARWLDPAERTRVADIVAADQAQIATTGRHTLLSATGDWRLWALASVYFCSNMCIYGVNFWMPTLIQELGLAKTAFLQIGLISAIPWGLAALAQVYWAGHSDRTQERRWHAAAGLALAASGMVILGSFGHAPIAAIAGMSCVTMGIMSFAGVFWSLPTSFLTGSAAVGGIALINSVGNLGGYIGPDMIGRMRDAAHGASAQAFLVLGAAGALGAVLVLLIPRSRKLPEAAVQTAN